MGRDIHLQRLESMGFLGPLPDLRYDTGTCRFELFLYKEAKEEMDWLEAKNRGAKNGNSRKM